MRVMEFKKYIKIYRFYIKSSILLLLNHRFNLIMSSVANLCWTFFQLFSLNIIFSKISDFKGWSFGDLVILLAFGQIFVYMSFIIYDINLDDLFDKIKDGTFDRMLLKPINVKFQASFEQVAIPQVLSMFTTVTPLFIYGIIKSETTPVNLLLSFLIVSLGLILMFFFRLLVAGLTFFFDDTQSLKATLLDSTKDVMRIPINFFPNPIRLIFIFLIPLAFVTFYPVMVLKGDTSAFNILITEVLLTAGFYMISNKVWKEGLKRYSGVG